MKIKFVTLTGADDSVPIDKLIHLSERYPYVEWAILFSPNKTGSARYPNKAWVDALIEATRDLREMNFSAHLCGRWVEEVMSGRFSFLEHHDYNLRFNRVQLNMGKERLQRTVENPKSLVSICDTVNQNIILGGNYKYIKVDAAFFVESSLLPLFDASGGRGVETREWPKPFIAADQPWLINGYAGGLGPENIATQLPRIAEAAGDTIIWVDMESRLRSTVEGKDIFDLEKCERVLQVAKDWIG